MFSLMRSKQKITFIVFGGLSLLSGCQPVENPQVNLIPQPAQMEITGGYLKLDSGEVFRDSPSSKLESVVDPSWKGGNPEAYELRVTSKGISLKAATEQGLYYGKQTLRQLYTPNGFPCVAIQDSARFPYRGLHLDVSRHFFPKEEVFKLLDVMAYYKMNRLHFHLTDAGGWRVESKKYPKLTTDAAFRTNSDWLEWWDGQERQFTTADDPKAYGGFYTQDEIRAIVAYAADRHITVLPEIEFPGHAFEVFFAYPELSCSGKAGVDHDFCIGNPATFTFMEEILSEMIDLFPSEYIHIGGDEAAKSSWKKCPKCQALMRKEGLKNVDELQSYMIHRAEEFLLSKGRKLIGWDEILEGGLAPEATVMSWRGESGGIKSARMGHDVIMTPGEYLYLDFYQADPRTQPYAIGGYTPIRKVYSYNPIPTDSLTEEEGKHIMGVQANTWTEYIKDEKYLEYMMFPRALAVAEIGWTPQEKRQWDSFKQRVNHHLPTLRSMGINHFPLSDEVEMIAEVDHQNKQIVVTLDAEKYPAEIHYTLDGSEPTLSSPVYTAPIVVKDSAIVKTIVAQEGKTSGFVCERRFDYHKGVNKPIHFNNKLYSGYMAGGVGALVDGYPGGLTYLDGHWQGYLDNLDCVIDLGKTQVISRVSARFMQLIGPGVFQPSEVELLTSENGKDFESRGVVPTTISNKDRALSFQDYLFTGSWNARYVRIKATNTNGFLFTDEVVIW